MWVTTEHRRKRRSLRPSRTALSGLLGNCTYEVLGGRIDDRADATITAIPARELVATHGRTRIGYTIAPVRSSNGRAGSAPIRLRLRDAQCRVWPEPLAHSETVERA